MRRLQADISAAQEKAQAAEVAIASAAMETSKLEERGAKMNQKKSQTNSVSKGLSKLLNSMTDQQKAAKLTSLRKENTSLKREIARLDFVLYGKNGRYKMWKSRPFSS
jgi:predicted  nucleic acid-binding Zn-ribbon protein